MEELGGRTLQRVEEAAAQSGSRRQVEVEVQRPSSVKVFSIKDHIKGEVETKNKVTTVVNGRDGHKKILRYDMKALVKYSAVMTCLADGTTFTMDNIALINVLVMFILSMCVAGLVCLAHIGNWDSLPDLETAPLEALAIQINSFVPFVLALYVSLTLTRWWTLRVAALGKVFDAFANISLLISCELHDKKWTVLRNQVVKYGFASIELLVQAARDNEDFDRLREPDFLTEVECRALKKVDMLWQRPMILWAWIMRICVAAMDHHKSPPPRTSAVMAQCISAREGMATINTYLDTQLPFAYVHLITLLVNVQNLFVSITSGVIFATAVPGANVSIMIQQVISQLIVCFIYQALLQISYMILDPFGDDVLDFPIKAYTSYLAACIDASMEAQPACPVVAEDGSLHRPKARKAAVPPPVHDGGE